MERLDVFDCSNVFMASYFTDNRDCAHCNREHTLIYIYSGELEITERGKKTVLHAGECAFMRRDNRMWLQKRVTDGKPYRSIVLKFSRNFLREFYQTLDRKGIPAESKRGKWSLRVLPNDRPDIRSLFESVIPYFDAGVKPSDDVLKLKMAEGVYTLLNTDDSLYDLSMEEIASYTGRSLATFKRDFAKVSDLTPQKWLIRRRLEAAHEQIRKGGCKISDICYDVGFKNLSHFSKIYKKAYGIAPTGSM